MQSLVNRVALFLLACPINKRVAREQTDGLIELDLALCKYGWPF